MAIEIRPAEPAEASHFARTMAAVFAWDLEDANLERFKTTWEPERSHCAYDNGKMVATLGTLSL